MSSDGAARRKWSSVVTTLAVVGVACAVMAQSPSRRPSRANAKPYTQWTAYGGGSHSAQYSALDQINKANISQLQVAWTFPVTGTVLFNPIVIDNVMYVQGTGNALVALDASTGKQLWSHPNQGAIGARGPGVRSRPARKRAEVNHSFGAGPPKGAVVIAEGADADVSDAHDR